MAYYNQFEFAPAPWLPIQDRQVLDSVGKKAFDAHIGKATRGCACARAAGYRRGTGAAGARC